MRLKIMGLILAGGKGTRLSPLTKERAKPAVPFGGKYRIVDFVLSNFINSGIYSIYVLIQFRSQSLLQHLRDGWQFARHAERTVHHPVPAQMRTPGESWYRGTADAVWQNANLIEQSRPDLVVLFGADHIYRMDIRQMVEFHAERKAGVTIAAIPVRQEGRQGLRHPRGRRRGPHHGLRREGPGRADDAGRPDLRLASMGNYIFDTASCCAAGRARRGRRGEPHDFGKDIIPALIGKAASTPTTSRPTGSPASGAPAPTGATSARSTPTTRRTWTCVAIDPPLNLYNRAWPIRTAGYSEPPRSSPSTRRAAAAQAHDSMLSGGCISLGRTIKRSVLGRWVNVIPAPRSRTRSCSRRRHRPARESPARHPREERQGP